MYLPHALPFYRGMCSFFTYFSIPTLFFCILVHGDIQLKYLYEDALAPSVPIDPSRQPQTVYAYGPNGFARVRPMHYNTNVMGYPFPEGTRAVSFLPLLSLLLLLHLSTAHSQEHEELVWLDGNLKLEVPQYSKDLYGPGRLAYPNNDDDDDNDDGDGDGGEDSEATLSYQPVKRCFQ